MELRDIISVPGMSGLFKVVANNKNGFIVESLIDAKRTHINSNQRIMSLVDVAVYTSGDDLPLRLIFRKISETESDKPGIDLKSSPEKIRDYFKTIVPDFDEERVYNSDIKKILSWYELLRGKVDFMKEPEASDEENPLLNTEQERPVQKVHEVHGPKAEQHAKTTSAKTRKKV